MNGVVRLTETTDPNLRMFLFHPGGLSHAIYADWSRYFPADWELLAIDLPGHGVLADAPPIWDVKHVVEYAKTLIRSSDDRPFVLFGHSMGAAVAFEVARSLAADRQPHPSWLGLSAMAPARSHRIFSGLLPRDPEQRRRVLATSVLRGQAHQALHNESAWGRFLRMFEADLAFMERWFQEQIPALPIPTSLFGGADDVFFAPEVVQEWSKYLPCLLGRHVFPGGHFYLTNALPSLAPRILTDIRIATSTLVL